MYINTTEAASYLEISPRRLRKLLQEERVKGAYKCGSAWLIPLYKGMPQIIERQHGQRGTWKKKRKPKRTLVHINRNKIASNLNKNPEEREPVISVKGRKNTYVDRLEIPFPCRLIYRPDRSLDCGARVWLEILDYDLEKTLPLTTTQDSFPLSS